MPRINQLPIASSVAQTDVLAIDTPNMTYQVPRSVLAPAPYIATIPTGQWSGSGSDYYITVTASNVTANAMLYPFYDNASAALLNGPVWVIPAAGSFTIHTSAIPSGTVTISVLLAGIVGEAQYQVLADVYSKSQVDTIVAQSTAVADGLASFTPGSGISTNALYIKRTGKLCVIRGDLNISGTVAGNNAVVGTLPAGFRPSQSMYPKFWSTYGTTTGFFSFTITPTGLIITGTGSNTFSGYIYLDLVFMTA